MWTRGHSTFTGFPLLAQRSLPADALYNLLLLTAVGFAVLIVLCVIVFLAYRYLTQRDKSAAVTTGFTLADVRRLHKTGQISDAEYAQARAAIIGRIAAEPPESSEPSESPTPSAPPESSKSTKIPADSAPERTADSTLDLPTDNPPENSQKLPPKQAPENLPPDND